MQLGIRTSSTGTIRLYPALIQGNSKEESHIQDIYTRIQSRILKFRTRVARQGKEPNVITKKAGELRASLIFCSKISNLTDFLVWKIYLKAAMGPILDFISCSKHTKLFSPSCCFHFDAHSGVQAVKSVTEQIWTKPSKWNIISKKSGNWYTKWIIAVGWRLYQHIPATINRPKTPAVHTPTYVQSEILKFFFASFYNLCIWSMKWNAHYVY